MFAAGVALMSVLMTNPMAASEYEALPILKASDLLPPEVLKSGLYQVDEAVTNDGYVNTYTIHSEYGDFTAYGLSLLKSRLLEVRALDELEQVEKTDLYVDAAANAIMAPVRAVSQFAKEPVDTVKGLPAGVGRMFRSWGRTANEVGDAVVESSTAEPCQEQDHTSESVETAQPDCVDQDGESQTVVYAKKFMGVSKSQRKWAQKLKVDPYTSNEILQAKLAEVASVDAAANLGANLLMPGLGIVGVAAKASSLVWSVAPAELRAQNLKQLQGQGASDEQIDAFLDNPNYSPTLQTVIVTALLRMEGVDNTPAVLDKALEAESEETAVFFTNTVRMLVAFHQSKQPLSRLITSGPLVGGLTQDQQLIYAVPVEYLIWSEDLARVLDGPMHKALLESADKTPEMWLLGQATSRAAEALSERGWVVRQQVRQQLLPGPSETQ